MNRPDILIFGAGGRLGAALARAWRDDFNIVPLGREAANLADAPRLTSLVREHRPAAVVNCAAMTNVDACEVERDLAQTVNALAPGAMAAACSQVGAKLIHISTDYVFQGTASAPYDEAAEPCPLSWYGVTKREGELRVLEAGLQHAVVRVSWVFGPDRDSFIDKALQTARRGEAVRAVADKFSSPSYTLDLAAALRPLLAKSSPGGIFHACNQGVCTWQEWAQAALDAAAGAGVVLPVRIVEAIRLADITSMTARRPVYSAMTCARLEGLALRSMRTWPEAVADYVRLLVREGRLA